VSLQDWVENGRLRRHNATRAEIRDLIKAADRDLSDSQVRGLSTDRKFATAYSAALLLASVALAASGFTVRETAHHYWTIQSLALTIVADKGIVDKLDMARKKRNIGDYERSCIVSSHEVGEMIDFARKLRVMVVDWLKKNHPELAAD
jgi:hypothetical protein